MEEWDMTCIGMQIEDLRQKAADVAWDIARICTWERTIG